MQRPVSCLIPADTVCDTNWTHQLTKWQIALNARGKLMLNQGIHYIISRLPSELTWCNISLAWGCNYKNWELMPSIIFPRKQYTPYLFPNKPTFRHNNNLSFQASLARPIISLYLDVTTFTNREEGHDDYHSEPAAQHSITDRNVSVCSRLEVLFFIYFQTWHKKFLFSVVGFDSFDASCLSTINI